MRRGVLSIVAAAIAFACAVAAAGGSYPGADGVIAFNRTSDHGLRASIYSIEADGSNLHRLTHGGGSDPAYSADGARIAFVRDGEIWVMGSNGETPRQLTNPARYIVDAQPAWSPDGERIIFVRSAGSVRGGANLWLMDADGGNPRKLSTSKLDERWPAWSPDGRRIAFTNVKLDGVRHSKPSGIYTMAAAGGDLEPVSVGRQQPFESDWSPDGRRLAFVRANGGRAQLLIVNRDGSDEHLLVHTRERASSPAFAPSGGSIAFTVGSTLSVVAADGGKPHALLEHLNNGADFGATWQPLPSP